MKKHKRRCFTNRKGDPKKITGTKNTGKKRNDGTIAGYKTQRKRTKCLMFRTHLTTPQHPCFQPHSSFRHARVKMAVPACYSIKLKKQGMVTGFILSACFVYKKVNSKSLGIRSAKKSSLTSLPVIFMRNDSVCTVCL